jgi:hypothetical protein
LKRGISKATLLFFFPEKKKRSKKRKAFRLPFYEKAMYRTTGSVTPPSSLRLATSSRRGGLYWIFQTKIPNLK